MVEWKVTIKGDLLFKNLSVQPDVACDSESSGCHLSSLAPFGGEKEIIFNVFYK